MHLKIHFTIIFKCVFEYGFLRSIGGSETMNAQMSFLHNNELRKLINFNRNKVARPIFIMCLYRSVFTNFLKSE
jgi:hypothetical protein